ncbi:MAG: NDP-sugar synthase [Actinobacteria bacterium]|nr:NDP-sugar synthase [Actinomycetota bacterium]
MEAIFLVGGKGTRLHPLTLERPKPMLKVAGVPFIAHQIGYATAHGITRIVVATSYKTEQFLDYLGDGSAFGIEIVYAIEEEPLGTGGAISNASAHLTSGDSEPVAILNGDILSAHNISAQIGLHKERGADVTLHLIEVDDARAFGSVPTDNEGRILEFIEKSDAPPTNFINAGCYIFTRSVIDEIPKGKVVSVERETFPELLSEGRKLWSFKSSEYWIDIGTPKALLKASHDLLHGVFHSPALSPEALVRKKFVDEQAKIDPSAQIGMGCAIGASIVGADAIIEESMVGDGVVIGVGAQIRASIIGDGVTVGAGAILRQSVLGGSALQRAPQSLE